MGTNVSTTFIEWPSEKKKTLGIKLPFLVMIIKNVSITHIFISEIPFKEANFENIAQEILYLRSTSNGW